MIFNMRVIDCEGQTLKEFKFEGEDNLMALLDAEHEVVRKMDCFKGMEIVGAGMFVNKDTSCRDICFEDSNGQEHSYILEIIK